MRLQVEEEGYFTLEAAIIGSMTCFLMLFVLVALCYFYDVGVTAAWLQENVAGRTLEKEENGEKEEDYSQAKKRLVLSEITNCKITENDTTIQGSASIAVKFPIPVVGDWLGKRWSNQIEIQMEKGNAPDQIRRWMLWKKQE